MGLSKSESSTYFHLHNPDFLPISQHYPSSDGQHDWCFSISKPPTRALEVAAASPLTPTAEFRQIFRLVLVEIIARLANLAVALGILVNFLPRFLVLGFPILVRPFVRSAVAKDEVFSCAFSLRLLVLCFMAVAFLLPAVVRRWVFLVSPGSSAILGGMLIGMIGYCEMMCVRMLLFLEW